MSERDPTLLADLQRLVEPATRGDPERPLLWVSKSLDKLASALGGMGHVISPDSVRKLLTELGFSRQANRKVAEGASHPDRNAQFEHINGKLAAAQAAGEPIVSVDTKKKELAADQGWVSVGITADTAAFAVQSIRTWLERMGRGRYPHARELTITADCGGSNGARVRLWKLECHLTDYFTDNALAAIEANKNRPFFMYLAYNAPHTPLQALKSDYDALPQIKDHTERVYGAMIRQLDRRIGDLLQKLKSTGLDENTLVIFTSDNGGAWYTGIKDHNTPYRGYKGTFFEGGIHVPMMMRWPGKIAQGTVRNDVAQHLDMFATIAAATGADVPADRKMDSFNLLGTGPKREITFWRSGDYRVVRAGDWKLQVSKRPDKVWLFNLATDPTEQVNLAAKHPARVAELRKLIETQNAGLPKSLWPGLLEGAIRIDVPLNAPWKKDQEYVYWAN